MMPKVSIIVPVYKVEEYVHECIDSILNQKFKDFEKERNCTVYAITHEYMIFGECYSFLYVPKYKQDWNGLVKSNGKEHQCFAYVWNKDDEWCSEASTIIVKSIGGGIKRIG